MLIKKHFQKDHLLRMDNHRYQKTVVALFDWLISTDRTENDLTAKLLNKNNAPASIHTKQDIVVAGMDEVEYLLKKYPEISFQKKVIDGGNVKKGEEIAIISGENKTILSLERTILNILQRMSGIATQTQKFAKLLYPVLVAATRKTPWMLLDKKAVAVGGGLTHRLDLSDGILIKDNHLQIIKNEYKLNTEAQAVTRALEMIKQFNNSFIEIEVITKESAYAAIKTYSSVIARSTMIMGDEALNTNSLAIMLDNWNTKDVKNFIKEVDASSIIFEASGNINESNLKEWAQTGVDIISSGALTHSAKAADLSLSIISA